MKIKPKPCKERLHFITRRCINHICLRATGHDGKHRCDCELQWITKPHDDSIPDDGYREVAGWTPKDGWKPNKGPSEKPN